MKPSFFILIFLLCISCGFSKNKETVTINHSLYKEGDIVFQISKSRQSLFIQLATASPWSNCGIIIEKNNKIYVLEASNVVKLTPLKEWKARGRFNLMKQRRIFDRPIKINYHKYLGQSYDLSFRFNNEKMYCSELVYEIYKEQFGIEIAKPRRVKDYHIIGLDKLFKKRGISKNQYVVAPSDLIR